jgi:hypothetical protein
MHANELCPAPHLEAADLGGNDAVVTITGTDFHEVGEARERKGVVQFKEFPRAMVLNRTNLRCIIALHGDETDTWPGKQITIYPSETDFGGQTVPCLRVRTELPKSRK